jgi:hypothetical protein
MMLGCCRKNCSKNVLLSNRNEIQVKLPRQLFATVISMSLISHSKQLLLDILLAISPEKVTGKQELFG